MFFPVVVLTGARQTGKTTLVQALARENGYAYTTFDDLSILRAAQEDPIGFLRRQPKPLILDEVQRVPELFLPLKQIVDEEQVVGQFLLTGSANPLLLPKLGDSLAGRMGILQMFPFSQGELLGKKEEFISWIFSPIFEARLFSKLNFEEFWLQIYKGGFPRVQYLKNETEIPIWIGSYLQSMLDRDIRDLSQIDGLQYFPDLFRLLATRSASLLNGSDIARTLKFSTSSIHRYLTLLETLFFIFRGPAWFSNRGKRITKSPKIYICDTGILCYLLKIDLTQFRTDPSLFGFILETFVASELLKQASWAEEKIEQHHFREGTQEVDIVLEQRDGTIVGIEVKSSATVRSTDFNGLKRLKELSSKKFLRGIILYTGSSVIPFGDDLWAVPMTALWEV
jgi:uncharacterized protein